MKFKEEEKIDTKDIFNSFDFNFSVLIDIKHISLCTHLLTDQWKHG